MFADNVFSFGDSDWKQSCDDADSAFDRALQQTWSEASRSNVMKYQIDRASHRLPSRVVSSHPFYFVAAYVPGRAPGQRRTPDSMSSLVMPFCAERFNFTKIKPCEKLFEMSFTSKNGKVSRASVLVNNSPVEYCSSLLVPSLAECLPQVLTAESVRFAIQTVALSGHRSLRVGFNSLGAMASVNHLHWHIYYFDHPLTIESLPVVDGLLQGWPVTAAVFEVADSVSEEAIDQVVDKVMRIVTFCLEDGNIAHNLFVTRSGAHNIRVLLWLVEPIFGSKNDLMINAALCELSGYFICKTEEMFHAIDEATCVEHLAKRVSLHHRIAHLL